jgi:hypothetical protein
MGHTIILLSPVPQSEGQGAPGKIIELHPALEKLKETIPEYPKSISSGAACPDSHHKSFFIRAVTLFRSRMATGEGYFFYGAIDA